MKTTCPNFAGDESRLSKDHPNVWSYTYRIRSHEVEPGGQMSVGTLLHLIQDGASSHAKSLGLSVSHLLQQGYTWVLSRLIFHILMPLPKWEEHLTIQTWPSGSKGPFALRDIIFKNDAGQTVAVALSGWLVIDAVTRKLQRIKPFSEALRPYIAPHVLTNGLEKVPLFREGDYERKFVVRRNELDINQHVNNVSYMEWLLETLPDAIVGSMSLGSAIINFVGEARQEDQVISTAKAIAGEAESEYPIFLHRIIRPRDHAELFRAKTVWGPKKGSPIGT